MSPAGQRHWNVTGKSERSRFHDVTRSAGSRNTAPTRYIPNEVRHAGHATVIHLTAIEYLAVLAVVTFGAAVQGVVGFGANLVAVPVLALVEPSALPATLSVWALPLNISMAVRERHGVDWSGATAIVVWRIPGTIAGALTVAAVSADTISVLAGMAVLAGVVASVMSTTVPVNRWTTAIAALASGAMGTATSVGGPPLALLYQNSEGVVLRSTLAVAFTAGLVVSLVGQGAVGVVAGWHVLLALALLPGVAAGLVFSRLMTQQRDGLWLRHAVLILAGSAALLAIGRGLG
jgi:uncharacterized membrane protein YfcA